MNILKRLKRKFFYILNHSLNHKVMIYWDGGICSQINMFCIGKCFEEKGYKVLHDITWFETCGKDLNGKKNRDLVFQRLFPNIKLNKASVKKAAFYREHFVSNEPDYKILKPPVYLPLYYEAFPYFFNYRTFFIENLKPEGFDANPQNISLLNEINSNADTCAVHVRRGDLSVPIQSYGEPPETHYFLSATEKILELNNKTYFYYFSDDPNWVKDNIFPKLNNNINYTLYTQNTENNGYMDLYLISKCKHVIASQGSFGLFAYVLSKMNGELICPETLPKTRKKMIKDNIPNIQFL